MRNAAAGGARGEADAKRRDSRAGVSLGRTEVGGRGSTTIDARGPQRTGTSSRTSAREAANRSDLSCAVRAGAVLR